MIGLRACELRSPHKALAALCHGTLKNFSADSDLASKIQKGIEDKTGITGCLTTALAVAFDPENDPAITFPVNLLY
jgi:hypothetical protein